MLLLATGSHQAYRAVRASYTLHWHVRRVRALDAMLPTAHRYPAHAALVKAVGKLLETVEAKAGGWQVGEDHGAADNSMGMQLSRAIVTSIITFNQPVCVMTCDHWYRLTSTNLYPSTIHQVCCERDPTLLPWLLQRSITTWPTPAALHALKIATAAAQPVQGATLPPHTLWTWLLQPFDSTDAPSALATMVNALVLQPRALQGPCVTLLCAVGTVCPEVCPSLSTTALALLPKAGPCGGALWDLATWAVKHHAAVDAATVAALWQGVRAANATVANHPRARTWTVAQSMLTGVDHAVFEDNAALLALPTEPVFAVQRLDALHAQVKYGPQSVCCRLTSALAIKACTLRLADSRAVKQVPYALLGDNIRIVLALCHTCEEAWCDSTSTCFTNHTGPQHHLCGVLCSRVCAGGPASRGLGAHRLPGGEPWAGRSQGVLCGAGGSHMHQGALSGKHL